MKSKVLFKMGYFSFMLGAGLESSIERKERSLSRPRLNGGLRVGVEGGDKVSSGSEFFSRELLWDAEASSLCGESGPCFFLSSEFWPPSGKGKPVASQADDGCEAWKSASITELVLWRLPFRPCPWSSRWSEFRPSVLVRTGKKFSNRWLFWIHCWATMEGNICFVRITQATLCTPESHSCDFCLENWNTHLWNTAFPREWKEWMNDADYTKATQISHTLK